MTAMFVFYSSANCPGSAPVPGHDDVSRRDQVDQERHVPDHIDHQAALISSRVPPNPMNADWMAMTLNLSSPS